MADKVVKGDFVEVDYTGKLPDGLIFDTTLEKVAKENNLFDPKQKYEAATICIGERQLLPGLDSGLEGKEVGKEYQVALKPEDAFGKRDVKKMRVMPSSTFKEHDMKPYPGLQIDVDGVMGTVTRVSGGRVIVNFNHPLAGKEVLYAVKINKKVTDQKEQVSAFLNTTLKLSRDKIKIDFSGEGKEKKAVVEIPMVLPEQFTSALGEKLADLTNLKSIEFKSKQEKK
tara:strand:+ start:1501 stop:2181 length:681 start_codon:yes stop_codon:yes gene_type:complete